MAGIQTKTENIFGLNITEIHEKNEFTPILNQISTQLKCKTEFCVLTKRYVTEKTLELLKKGNRCQKIYHKILEEKSALIFI